MTPWTYRYRLVTDDPEACTTRTIWEVCEGDRIVATCRRREDAEAIATAHAVLRPKGVPTERPITLPRAMLFSCRWCGDSEWITQPTGAEIPDGWANRGDGPPLCPGCVAEYDREQSTPTAPERE